MLGAGDLLPGGSRWSAKVVKHEKSSRSRGFMADLWERVKVNEGHNSWTSGMRMLFPSARQALFEFRTRCHEKLRYLPPLKIVK